MLVEKDLRLLVTAPDGSVTDVRLAKTVHSDSGISFTTRNGLRSWLAEFNLLASVGEDRVARLAQSLKEDTTVTTIADKKFWNAKVFEGLIFVDLSPSELWKRINQAQESKHACIDLTPVTGPGALRNVLERKIAALVR